MEVFSLLIPRLSPAFSPRFIALEIKKNALLPPKTPPVLKLKAPHRVTAQPRLRAGKIDPRKIKKISPSIKPGAKKLPILQTSSSALKEINGGKFLASREISLGEGSGEPAGDPSLAGGTPASGFKTADPLPVAPSPVQEKPLAPAERGQQLSDFQRLVNSRLNQVRKYPPQARAEGVSGEVTLRFLVKPDGSITEPEIAASSGSRDLDQAGRLAAQQAQPFLPFPPGFPSGIKIKAKVVFKLTP